MKQLITDNVRNHEQGLTADLPADVIKNGRYIIKQSLFPELHVTKVLRLCGHEVVSESFHNSQNENDELQTFSSHEVFSF